MRSEEKQKGGFYIKNPPFPLFCPLSYYTAALLYSFDKRSSTLMLFGLEVFPLCLYLAVQF